MSPAERDVLTSLPRTRPTRRSAKRGAAPAPVAPPAAVEELVQEAPAAVVEAPAAAAAEPVAAADPPPTSGWSSEAEGGHLRGRALVGTGVQAAGELAHIGLTVYTRAVKSAFRRLPKP